MANSHDVSGGRSPTGVPDITSGVDRAARVRRGAMRSKKAKKLRRLAESMTVGKPRWRYVTLSDGSQMVDPGSTRGTYRLLKKV